jgi:hypothetical protein
LAGQPLVGITDFAERFDFFPSGLSFVISVLFATQGAPSNDDSPTLVNFDLPPAPRQTHSNPRRTAAPFPMAARLRSQRNSDKSWPLNVDKITFDSFAPKIWELGAKLRGETFSTLTVHSDRPAMRTYAEVPTSYAPRS